MEETSTSKMRRFFPERDKKLQVATKRRETFRLIRSNVSSCEGFLHNATEALISCTMEETSAEKCGGFFRDTTERSKN